MQLASLLGIGAKPEIDAKNSMDTNANNNGIDAGFLSLLVGLSSAQQMPVAAEPIIKTDNAEANNIEAASLSGGNAKAGNPLNTSLIAETITKDDSAVKVNDEAAALADSKNKADNVLNIPLNAEPIIKTDSAEANNIIEEAALVDGKNKADNPLNISFTAEPVIKTDNNAEANNIEGKLVVNNIKEENSLNMFFNAEANDIEEASSFVSNVKTENPLNTAPFLVGNGLLADIVSSDVIRNLVQVKENSNKSGDAETNQLSTAETDETIAIDTAKSAVTMDELNRQDFIKGYKPVLNSAHQDLRLSSHNQLPMPNNLSPDISKPSPNLSTDASEGEDADVKSLLQSDNISNSMFNKISDEHSALSNQHSDEDDFIQSSLSRNDAVIDAGGIGKTKDILTIGKAEAHGQIDNKAVETQVVEKTAQGIRVIATDGGGRMKISLYPESLGHIRIDVSVNNDGIVNARMVTENSQIKDVIDNNISKLRDSLLQQGLKIDNFSVSVDQQRQSDWTAYEEKMFWHRNPEQEMPAGYHAMTYDPQIAAHDSRIAMGNVDIFV